MYVDIYSRDIINTQSIYVCTIDADGMVTEFEVWAAQRADMNIVKQALCFRRKKSNECCFFKMNDDFCECLLGGDCDIYTRIYMYIYMYIHTYMHWQRDKCTYSSVFVCTDVHISIHIRMNIGKKGCGR